MSLFKNLAAAVGAGKAPSPESQAKTVPSDQPMRLDSVQVRRPVIDEDEEVTHETLSVAASRPMLKVIRPAAGSPDRFFVSPTGVTTIGRGSDNDIVIAGAAASVHHCRLDQKDKTFTLVDLGSTNKTWVNGKAVESAVLRNGDEIVVGDSVFAFALFANRT